MAVFDKKKVHHAISVKIKGKKLTENDLKKVNMTTKIWSFMNLGWLGFQLLIIDQNIILNSGTITTPMDEKVKFMRINLQQEVAWAG